MNTKKHQPLQLERLFHAPAEKLWQALTDPVQMKKWYFDLPGFRAEVGYQFRFEGGPPGRVYVHLCEVTEALPNRRLSYTWRYEGYEGNSLVTFELFPQGDKTLLRLTHAGLETFPSSNPDLAAGNFKMGWTGFLRTELHRYLQNEPVFRISRTINAPRDLVYQMWTDAAHLAQWWGPIGMELSVLKLELQQGGIFHYGMKGPNGGMMYGRFVFRDILPPERLIWTTSFADEKGNAIRAPFSDQFPVETYNVLTLTDLGDKTRLTLSGCPINASQAELDFYRNMFDSMKNGFGGTFKQLMAYVTAKYAKSAKG